VRSELFIIRVKVTLYRLKIPLLLTNIKSSK